jgi:hypothetical protein
MLNVSELQRASPHSLRNVPAMFKTLLIRAVLQDFLDFGSFLSLLVVSRMSYVLASRFPKLMWYLAGKGRDLHGIFRMVPALSVCMGEEAPADGNFEELLTRIVDACPGVGREAFLGGGPDSALMDIARPLGATPLSHGFDLLKMLRITGAPRSSSFPLSLVARFSSLRVLEIPSSGAVGNIKDLVGLVHIKKLDANNCPGISGLMSARSTLADSEVSHPLVF